MYREVGYLRALQAEDQRKGVQNEHVRVNLILDNKYQRELFDNTTLYIDGTQKVRQLWLEDLARPLGLVTTQSRFNRRAAIALGIGSVVTLSATGVAIKHCSVPYLSYLFSQVGAEQFLSISLTVLARNQFRL